MYRLPLSEQDLNVYNFVMGKKGACTSLSNNGLYIHTHTLLLSWGNPTKIRI